MKSVPIFLKNFQTRTDLRKFGSNALLLYAFELKFDIEDIDSFASENMVEANNDKKCDLIFVNYDARTAIITQSYYAQKIKKEAKANKASDLNTAAGWLLSSDIKKIPETIKDAAIELRNAIKNMQIDTIEFWFLHNCHESKNVTDELEIVGKTVSNALKTYYTENTSINVKTAEVDLETIDSWYMSSKAIILVTNTFTIDIPGGYSLKEGDWDAFSTSIPIKWLYEVSKTYRKPLFSANVRDYLGSRKSDSNINNSIKETAQKLPNMFWVYNNGITAIVNDFEPIYDTSKKRIEKLKINGISIVNGAQTTGAIGSLAVAPNANGFVSARFIKSNNQATVRNIIRYNNSQNKISPSDFRSTDQYQEKLRKEFEKYKESVVYTGGRRGGDEDKIRRPQNYLPFEKVTQSLAAFHQYPGLAYNGKTELWESDTYYSKIFNEDTTAEHIIFAYSLFKYISDFKLSLMKKYKENGQLIEDEQKALEFLRKRGSHYIFIAGIAASLETITSKPITSKFHCKFIKQPSLDKATSIWEQLVSSLIAFNSAYDTSLNNGLKNNEQIANNIEQFKSLVSATKRPLHKIYADFAGNVRTEK
jgi:hypothetical protein